MSIYDPYRGYDVRICVESKGLQDSFHWLVFIGRVKLRKCYLVPDWIIAVGRATNPPPARSPTTNRPVTNQLRPLGFMYCRVISIIEPLSEPHEYKGGEASFDLQWELRLCSQTKDVTTAYILCKNLVEIQQWNLLRFWNIEMWSSLEHCSTAFS